MKCIRPSVFYNAVFEIAVKQAYGSKITFSVSFQSTNFDSLINKQNKYNG